MGEVGRKEEGLELPPNRSRSKKKPHPYSIQESLPQIRLGDREGLRKTEARPGTALMATEDDRKGLLPAMWTHRPIHLCGDHQSRGAQTDLSPDPQRHKKYACTQRWAHVHPELHTQLCIRHKRAPRNWQEVTDIDVEQADGHKQNMPTEK